MEITPITTPVILSDSKYNEEIIVIKRDLLFAYQPVWNGIQQVDVELYSDLILTKKESMLRGLAENDVKYKQIIPYVIFKHNETYFLMQRSATSSESRLAAKYTLGIGGHLRKKDMVSNNITEWGQREFHEEINYSGKLSYQILGILNDDSNDVGKVHMGIVICATGDSDAISIKSELALGTLVNLETCAAHFDKLETWSQHVIRFLQASYE